MSNRRLRTSLTLLFLIAVSVTPTVLLVALLRDVGLVDLVGLIREATSVVWWASNDVDDDESLDTLVRRANFNEPPLVSHQRRLRAASEPHRYSSATSKSTATATLTLTSPMDAFHETFNSMPHRPLVSHLPPYWSVATRQQSPPSFWRRFVAKTEQTPPATVPTTIPTKASPRATQGYRYDHSTQSLVSSPSRWLRPFPDTSLTRHTIATATATLSPMDAYDTATTTTTASMHLPIPVVATQTESMTASDEFFVRSTSTGSSQRIQEMVATHRRLTEVRQESSLRPNRVLSVDANAAATDTSTGTPPPSQPLAPHAATWWTMIVEWVHASHWTTLVIVFGCGSLALVATCLATCCCVCDVISCARSRKRRQQRQQQDDPIKIHSLETEQPSKLSHEPDETENSTADDDHVADWETECGVVGADHTLTCDDGFAPSVNPSMYQANSFQQDRSFDRRRSRLHLSHDDDLVDSGIPTTIPRKAKPWFYVPSNTPLESTSTVSTSTTALECIPEVSDAQTMPHTAPTVSPKTSCNLQLATRVTQPMLEASLSHRDTSGGSRNNDTDSESFADHTVATDASVISAASSTASPFLLFATGGSSADCVAISLVDDGNSSVETGTVKLPSILRANMRRPDVDNHPPIRSAHQREAWAEFENNTGNDGDGDVDNFPLVEQWKRQRSALNLSSAKKRLAVSKECNDFVEI